MNDEELGYARQRARMRNLEHVPGTNERNKDYTQPPNQDGGGCLPSSTRIATPKGLTAVGDVSVGDEVNAYDAASGQITIRRVIAKSSYGEQRLVEFKVDGGAPIVASLGHSFLINGSYARASTIRVGSVLIREVSSGKVSEVSVTSVAYPKSTTEVFKLVVEQDFTVLPESIVSHSFTHLRTLQEFYWRVLSALGLTDVGHTLPSVNMR